MTSSPTPSVVSPSTERPSVLLVPRLSPQLMRMVWRAVMTFAIFHAAVQWCCLLPLHIIGTHHGHGHDMEIYYRAAMRLRGGEAVYQP